MSKVYYVVYFFILLLASCSSPEKMEVSSLAIDPGTSIRFDGKKIPLYSGSLKVGDNLNDIFEETLNTRPINAVSIINIVPSIDTPICEEQTHLLGETKLSSRISRFLVSRDLPMAQLRFAKEAHLQNITYLSDYKKGSFGAKTGLLMKEYELLARGVIVTNITGEVVYIQLVENVNSLPDMDKAFKVASDLLK